MFAFSERCASHLRTSGQSSTASIFNLFLLLRITRRSGRRITGPRKEEEEQERRKKPVSDSATFSHTTFTDLIIIGVVVDIITISIIIINVISSLVNHLLSLVLFPSYVPPYQLQKQMATAFHSNNFVYCELCNRVTMRLYRF